MFAILLFVFYASRLFLVPYFSLLSSALSESLQCGILIPLMIFFTILVLSYFPCRFSKAYENTFQIDTNLTTVRYNNVTLI